MTTDLLTLAGRQQLLTPAGLGEADLHSALFCLLGCAIDSGDLYFQQRRAESWGLEDQQVKSASHAIQQGVGVRAISGVIILGGTNDLGWNADPAEIMRNLLKMYELARANSVVPVPVTVPSIRVELGGDNPEAASWLAQHLQRRQRLNAMIAEYADAKGLRYLDLFTATAEPDSLMLARPYSNDGLHLTTSGYRLFGQLAYERLFGDESGLLGLPPSGAAHS